MEYLAEMPQLRNVILGCTNVGDQGLKSLTRIKSLNELKLFKTKVTDAGMPHLAHSPN